MIRELSPHHSTPQHSTGRDRDVSPVDCPIHTHTAPGAGSPTHRLLQNARAIRCEGQPVGCLVRNKGRRSKHQAMIRGAHWFRQPN
eukprot:1910536-Pleurochrysis_carterae.AAC.1